MWTFGCLSPVFQRFSAHRVDHGLWSALPRAPQLTDSSAGSSGSRSPPDASRAAMSSAPSSGSPAGSRTLAQRQPRLQDDSSAGREAACPAGRGRRSGRRTAGSCDGAHGRRGRRRSAVGGRAEDSASRQDPRRRRPRPRVRTTPARRAGPYADRAGRADRSAARRRPPPRAPERDRPAVPPVVGAHGGLEPCLSDPGTASAVTQQMAPAVRAVPGVEVRAHGDQPGAAGDDGARQFAEGARVRGHGVGGQGEPACAELASQGAGQLGAQLPRRAWPFRRRRRTRRSAAHHLPRPGRSRSPPPP